MNKRRLIAQKGRAAASTSLTVGIPLAALWALHAAATHLPGAGYLRLPILFVMAAGFVVWRLASGHARPRFTHKHGITLGLCCWAAAGTLSAIFNWQTDQVILTYISVFLAGGAVYVALARVELTPADLDVAITGLVVGSLFPLIGGLSAFVSEWGIPDIGTTVSAWQSVTRMDGYGDATFGNRGNTAGFLLIVTPIFLAILFDKRKHLGLRALCGATLVPIALNLLILQVRAAFVTLLLVMAFVWVFKQGFRRVPLFAAAVVLGALLLFKFQPDAGLTMAERLLPALTVDTGGDESVQGRVDAIEEGWQIASNHWLLGIGPGAALTEHSRASAHQFQIQQAMETGILGLVGAILLSFGVWISLFRTMAIGRDDQVNDTRFLLLIGPAAYLTYSVIANAALNNATVNTWTVLVASMLALMPPFERRVRRARGWARIRTTAAQPSLNRPNSLPSLAR
jgi:hypothetical protein